jgi:hypothetical protein
VSATNLTPAERTLRASRAAHIRWANTDRREASAAQRRRMFERFEAQIPPAVVDPAERAKRAENLLSAHMLKLAFESSKARRRKKAA